MAVNDANCTGSCRCPWCKGRAHWSLVEKLHACADPECEGAKGFQDHTQNEEVCGYCGRVDCRCDPED